MDAATINAGATVTASPGYDSSVSTLAVGTGNTIQIGNKYLYLVTTSGNVPVQNDGLININSFPGNNGIWDNRFDIPMTNRSSSFSGSGVVALNGPNCLIGFHYPLLNGSGHTIKGAGQILGGAQVTNNGNILAENGALYVLNPISQGSGGVIGARQGGTLYSNQPVTGGTILPNADGGSGNSFFQEGATLSGVTIGAGTMTTSGCTLTGNNALLNGASFNIPNNCTVYFNGDQTCINNSTISLLSTDGVTSMWIVGVVTAFVGRMISGASEKWKPENLG